MSGMRSMLGCMHMQVFYIRHAGPAEHDSRVLVPQFVIEVLNGLLQDGRRDLGKLDLPKFSFRKAAYRAQTVPRTRHVWTMTGGDALQAQP